MICTIFLVPLIMILESFVNPYAAESRDNEITNKIKKEVNHAIETIVKSSEKNLQTEYVTPEMFGAVGDGTVDDTYAIETALETGKTLLLCNKYLVSRTLFVKQDIIGVRNGTITLSRDADCKLLKIISPNIVIKDICIIGNKVHEMREKSGYGHCIDIESDSVYLERLRIMHSSGDGIYIGGDYNTNYIVIDSCVIDNCSRNGISIVSANEFRVQNCIIKNTSGTMPQCGIDIEPNNPKQSIRGRIENVKSFNCRGRGLSCVMENVNNKTLFDVFVDKYVSENDGYDDQMPNVSSIYIAEYADCKSCKISLMNAEVRKSKIASLTIKSLSCSSSRIKAHVDIWDTVVIPVCFFINNGSANDIDSYDITIYCNQGCENKYSAKFQRLSKNLERTYHIKYVSNKPFVTSLNKLPTIVTE